MQDEDVTLESVPGFDRPMSANPNDRVVGEDELGRRVYETVTGQRYTLSLNPDQRTSRTRFEEDILPEMQGYLENPTLPTVSQAAGFVGDVAQGAYESLEAAVEGRGTLGDVAGVAVGSGVGSMFGEAPEGAIRLFGGFRAARHPGQDAEGRELPRSVGADELDRFEIDDSFADFDVNRVPQQSLSSLDNSVDSPKVLANPQDYFATLDQVLDHPELYRQYPEFRDLLVVEDTTIRQGVGGYYNDKLNLLAVSPRIARDPNLFKGVLLHEIQHAIQKLEGFDRGTSQLSPEVAEAAGPRLQEAQRKYDEALQGFESFDFEPALDDVKIFIGELLDDLEADGLAAPEDITFSTPHRTGWEQNLNVLAERLAEDRVSPLDSYETLLDFYALIRDNPNLVVDKDVFKDSFGVTPDDLVDSDVGSFLNSLESAEVIPVDPQRLKFLETDILRDVYRSRSGEVEARNVQKRLGLSLADRFNQTPESTEDPRYPRSEQWRVPREEPAEFNRGGVVSMEEQMSLFDMGGLTDDGAMRDPVSGNEVPPGSMASEVRDDVPAMLSEGEYIVPADVVRYYGVKFFEDLRGQAKSGLMDMERNGRIGGEPVPGPAMSGEGELTPEEMAMLAQITGMYGGGMVRKGYQTGGTVTQEDFMNQAQQAEGFRLPSSVFAPSAPTAQPTAPFTPVTLYGPTGDTMLATSQEQYNSLIAQGYTTQPRVTQPAAPTGGDSGGGDGGFGTDDLEAAGGGFRLNDENLESLRNNPLAFGTEALGAELPLGASTRQVAGALSMVAGPAGMVAGGLAGAAFELDNIAKARAGLAIAESQGLTGTPEYAALETSLNAALENLTGPAKLLENLGLGSGKSYINQVGTVVPAVTPTTTRTPSGGSRTPVSDAGLSRAASMTEAEKAAGRAYAATGSDREETWSGGQVGVSSSDKEKSDAVRGGGTAAGKEYGGTDISSGGYSGKGYTSGRATGGLVAKPSRKKPVAKKK